MASSVLALASLVLVIIQSTNSVVMPPRVQVPLDKTNGDLDPKLAHELGLVGLPQVVDSPKAMISIPQGYSMELLIHSSSYIAVNLNRPIVEDLNVLVKVYAGEGLIHLQNLDQSPGQSEVTVTFPAKTFGDRLVKIMTNNIAGHAEIVCTVTKQPAQTPVDDSSAYISIDVGKNDIVNTTIQIVGWIYFVAWSVSFYFQVILNFQRKSVIGLNFDFLALNLLGFTCYTIFNYTLMFSREVQKEYYDTHKYSRIPVEINDLFFSMHAVILTTITILQCFIYERGQQKVSNGTIVLITLASSIGLGLFIVHYFTAFTLLSVITYLSYVKLTITMLKYIPQAHMNYKRKATTGWSIHNILLDFTGGTFSLAQMFLIAYNYNDWGSIFGNFTKFGLGVISIGFDITFLLQHYVFYSDKGRLEASTDSAPEPVLSRSIRSFQSGSYSRRVPYDPQSETTPGNTPPL